MSLEGVLIGVGAVLTGLGAIFQGLRSKALRGDLRAVREQVTPSNGVPTAVMIEQILEEIRQDRASVVSHLQDNERHR